MKQTKSVYSLIPLEDFKAHLNIDDREEALTRFCLTISAHTIEQHCMRRFLRKKRFELIRFTGDLHLPLIHYPVTEVLAVFALADVSDIDGALIEPDFYKVLPETEEDVPYSITLSPAVKRLMHIEAFRVFYWAGYAKGKVPADLSSACMELAVWNMARYRSRRVGMTGAVRGQGKDGDHFEPAMPANVKALLEPYRRRVI